MVLSNTASTTPFPSSSSQATPEQTLHAYIERSFLRFMQVGNNYLIFNCISFFIVLLEIVALLFLIAYLPHSSALAVTISLLFTTGFAYTILRLYFHTKQPEQYHLIRQHFIYECKELLLYDEHNPSSLHTLANALCQHAATLQGQEYHFYTLPSSIKQIQPLAEKFSCWWHWKEVIQMQEHILDYAIHERIQRVKLEPTNFEAHAALANTYLLLSDIYYIPEKDEEHRWTPHEKNSRDLKNKFSLAAHQAIEELKILNEYSPNDLWVHKQLAHTYHKFKMYEEEMQEYETIISLAHDDYEAMYQLGVLYFQHGKNGKGLKIYDTLCHKKQSKAEQLIKFYGTGDPI